MGKYDKDRYQKELALRYCLARGDIPFLEVLVPSVSDLSDSVETLTDLDVVGVSLVADGTLRRTLFDCKTSNRMSSINRAFWAAGVRDYTGFDDATVILKSKAVHNHRLSALTVNVDLHTEESFRDLAKTLDAAISDETYYQSSVERWNAVCSCYSKHSWSAALFEQARHQVPLARTPTSVFRKILAELRSARGNFDPEKEDHLSIFFDILASTFVLWAILGRDIRRFYEPGMSKDEFTRILRYYLWGGRDSYSTRQQIRQRSSSMEDDQGAVELPAWNLLVSFAGIVVSSPQNLIQCAHVCRELSIRFVSGPNALFDDQLRNTVVSNNRVRQFITALGEYLVAGGGLPRDMIQRINEAAFRTDE